MRRRKRSTRPAIEQLEARNLFATDLIRQWADEVLDFSSEWHPFFQSAEEALGIPDTLTYGESPAAWSPVAKNATKEFLLLGFTTPVYASQVNVIETYGNGFVTQIDLLDVDGNLHNVWKGIDTIPAGMVGNFEINFAVTPYLVAGVKVYVDTNHNLATFEEIDGVALTGTTTKASHLVIATQPPASVIAGSTFGCVVQVQDDVGSLLTSYNGNVTVSLPNHPGTSLGGALTVPIVNGVGTFSGLTLTAAGSDYTLQATATGLAPVTSNAFTVSSAAATQVVITAQPPANVTAGENFAVSAEIRDNFGNRVTSFSDNVTANLAGNPARGTLGGTVTVAANGGLIAFTGLQLNRAGSGYTLQLEASGLTPGNSSALAVTSGPVSTLIFSGQPPASVHAGSAFAVAAADTFGNPVPSFNGSATFSLASNPGGSFLSGSHSIALVNGVAILSDLTLNRAGIGYTLQVTVDNLAPALSQSFNVVGGTTTVLFQDAFDQATGSSLSSNWIGRVGISTVVNQTATGASAVSLATAMTRPAVNVAVQAELNLTVGRAGLVARYNGKGDGNMYCGYLAVVDGSLRAGISLFKAGNEKVLATSLPLSPGRGTLEFLVVGTSLKLFWNGSLVARAFDAALKTGLVGFRVNAGGGIASFQADSVAMPSSAVPFLDNFTIRGDGSQLGAAWLDRTGNQAIVDRAVTGSAALNLATLNTAPQANATIQADVSLTSGSAGLVARYSGPGNYYFASLTVAKGKLQAGIFYVNKVGVVKRLDKNGQAIDLGPGILRFQLAGKNLTLSWNNGTGFRTIASVRDATLVKGLVGIRQGQGASVRNFLAFGPAPNAAAPTSLLTLSGNFDPAATTHVLFTDASGYRVEVPASNVTANSVEVPVPLYYDGRTLQLGAGPGLVSVSVRQQMGAAVTTQVVRDNFLITDLPRTGLEAGKLTSLYLAGLEVLLNDIARNYQAVQQASQGSVPVGPLVDLLRSLQGNFADLRRQVAAIMKGELDRLDLGQKNGVDIYLDRSSLALLDRIIAAQVQAETGAPQGSLAFASARAAAAFAAGDDELNWANKLGANFAQKMQETAAQAFTKASKAILDNGKVMLGVGTAVTALILGAPAAGAAAVGVGAVMAAATLYPALANTVALEGGVNQLIHGKASISDFKETGKQIRTIAEETVEQMRGTLDDDAEEGSLVEEISDRIEEVRDAYDSVQELTEENHADVVEDVQPPADNVGIHVDGPSSFDLQSPGATDEFDVSLESQPLGDVTIDISSSDPSDGSVDKEQLVFTPDNWDQPQTVKVTAENEAGSDANGDFAIDFAPAQSGDPRYRNATAPSIPGKSNSSGAGVIITPTSGLVTSEGGGLASMAQFTVVLKSRPTADVFFDMESSNDKEGTVFPPSVRFTPDDWNRPQTVVVTGSNDNVKDGDQHYMIITNLTHSDDPRYNNIDPPDVSLINKDTTKTIAEPIEGHWKGTGQANASLQTFAAEDSISATWTINVELDVVIKVEADGVSVTGTEKITNTNFSYSGPEWLRQASTPQDRTNSINLKFQGSGDPISRLVLDFVLNGQSFHQEITLSGDTLTWTIPGFVDRDAFHAAEVSAYTVTLSRVGP